MRSTLAILLAGGAGERLYPLTRNTAKPAVPFGGMYRIIDFTLSNCINSNVRRVFVLAQYKALDLMRHLRSGWSFLSSELGEFIEVITPMKRVHDDWFLGTADAVYQNIESIEAEAPELTLILSGDHIYKMDYHEMVQWHLDLNADITIATIQAPPSEATRFGVAQIGADYRVLGFEEKPQHGNPTPSVFNSAMVSASMGIYVFRTEVLLDALRQDAERITSSHDFGRDILPAWIPRARVMAYDFHDLNDKTVKYWRDVGTIDAYYDANMDLISVTPQFNLYDKRWPVRTHMDQRPPAKFVFAQEGRRIGVAIDSIVSPGCIVSGGRVMRSVLSPGVRVNSYCDVDESILLEDVEIGRYCRIRRAILEAGVKVPDGTEIGIREDEDRARGYTISEGGITVVPANLVPQFSLVSNER
jgi:glucose-1-phosphate adenylyltransferase